MTLPRRALPLLAVILPLAMAARSAPLTLEELIEFHDSGLTPEAFEGLVVREGLAEPIGADAARELQAAGFSSQLVSWLITSGTSRPGGVEGVEYEVDGEGVLVVSGAGSEPAMSSDAEDEAERPDDDEGRLFEPSTASATASAAPTFILMASPPAPVLLPGYTVPWGSTSVAQVPARFGDPTSAFGTTIVSVAGAPACGLVGSLGTPASLMRPEPRRVPVHTSRGTLYLPN